MGIDADLAMRLFESLPSGVAVFSAGGRLEQMNAAAKDLLRLPEVRPDLKAADFLPAAVAANIEKALADPKAAPPSHLPAGGLGINFTVRPLGSGAAVVVICPATADGGETKRLFAANLGHEMKTPLTSIKAYTEALMDMTEDEQTRSFLKIIDEENERLIRMINDLVARARAEAGKQP